jgi:hypothetical protein
LHDEEDNISAKPSTVSKKKKVKKLKKKKAGVNANNIEDEYDGPSGRKLDPQPYETNNDSRGAGSASDDGGMSQMAKSMKPPQRP